MKMSEVHNRIFIFSLLFFTVFFSIIYKLYEIQFKKAERLKKLGDRLHTRRILIERERGEILDRNGITLALSKAVNSIYAVPKEIQNYQETINKLSKVLSIDPELILMRLLRSRNFVWLKRKVSKEKEQEVRKLNLKGIHFLKEYERFYPHSRLACHVLGFVGIDDIGLEGLEFKYDKLLEGHSGWMIFESDVRGFALPEGKTKIIPPYGGYKIKLTIDAVVQHIVEEEIKKVYEEFEAKSAIGIVMNIKNGEILAIANLPDYDLNKFYKFKSYTRRNRAVTDAFEPGSIMKIVTAAAALSEKLVDEDTILTCKGYVKIGKFQINCHAIHGEINLEKAIAYSCNSAMIQLGLKLGKKLLYKYLKKFGFGEKTGIELPGEAKGLIRPYKRWADIDLGATAIGQSVAVTAVQLIKAIAVVGNKGIAVRPHVVKAILSSEGKVIKEYKVAPYGRVISEEVAGKLLKYMLDVVKEGTGKKARLQYYFVAGKTATAQKVGRSGKYEEGKLVASFIGLGPVSDPEIITLVVVDEPKGEKIYGGVVAATAFKSIADKVFAYLKIIPEKLPKENLISKDEQDEIVRVPDFKFLKYASAIKRAEKLEIKLRVLGRGNKIIYQYPEPGVKLKKGRFVTVILGTAEKLKTGLPSFLGLSLKQAMEKASKFQLRCNYIGSGKVIAQSPPPGSEFNRNSIIELHLK